VDLEIAERRTEPRRPGTDLQIIHATVRPGHAIQVVDLSRTGAQIETDRALRPGTRVHIRLVSQEGTSVLAAQVLRCSVSALRPDDGVMYRGAVLFEDRCSVAVAFVSLAVMGE
jgi:PilZ domain